MGSNYWSCTKFADWVRGTPKIEAGTEKEWRDWKHIAKKKRVRYWLAEEGLDYLQNFINWPSNRLQDVRHYIDNRWISKTHALTSNLKKGQWHEFDTRLLNAPFDSLVDFVEVELAWFHMVCSDEAYKKYKTPWYRTIFSSCHNPESGMEYLNWAASLRHNEDWIDQNDPDFGKPTNQALAAQETIALYKWWKEVRPARQDPMEATGWSAYCDERRQKAEIQGFDLIVPILEEDETEEEKARARQILELLHKMELEQENEDTEMLIRLIKIRKHLWT